MACGSCEAKRKAREAQQRAALYSPRPKENLQKEVKQPKPASSKFQSPNVLPPIK